MIHVFEDHVHIGFIKGQSKSKASREIVTFLAHHFLEMNNIWMSQRLQEFNLPDRCNRELGN